jgi:hypothetical protein
MLCQTLYLYSSSLTVECEIADLLDFSSTNLLHITAVYRIFMPTVCNEIFSDVQSSTMFRRLSLPPSSRVGVVAHVALVFMYIEICCRAQ